MNNVRSFLFSIMMLALGLIPCSVQADAIDFVGVSGGTISYDGQGGPLIGSNLPIAFVFGIPPGSPLYPVDSGILSFTTGSFSSSSGVVGAYTDVFAPGGNITITGGVLAAGIGSGSTLLSGTFSSAPQFTYAGGFGYMTASLGNVIVNDSLFQLFGFTPPFPSGSIVQLDLTLSGGAAPGTAFSAIQASANIGVSTPEPTSLLLLGSGLTGLGLLGRRKKSKVTKA